MSYVSPDEIEKIWRKVSPTLTFGANWNATLSQTASYYAATAALVSNDVERPACAEAREALLSWCAERRKSDGAHVDNRIIAVDEALRALPEGWFWQPARPWVIAVLPIWSVAGNALASIPKPNTIKNPRGTSATSFAIRFTSKLLKHLGYPEATSHAVRKEVEKHRCRKAKVS